MKLSNIFGKKTAKTDSSKIEKLEKNQLSNVLGGGAPIKGVYTTAAATKGLCSTEATPGSDDSAAPAGGI